MRLDRILSEGEALVSLRRMGFTVTPVEGRPGLYEVTHPQIGGQRVFTVDQLADFAAGASVLESHLRGTPTTSLNV